MREYLTYGLMWQGVETSTSGARRHSLTLRADARLIGARRGSVVDVGRTRRNEYEPDQIGDVGSSTELVKARSADRNSHNRSDSAFFERVRLPGNAGLHW